MAGTDYKIIDADFNNTDHINDLIKVLENYKTGDMGDGKPYTDSEKARLTTQFIVNPNVLVFLIYSEGVIVGGSVCFKSFSTFSTDNIINIHDLCIIDKFRGKGFGRALTDYIVEKGREQLCSRITLEVREDNGIAQSLYKKFGFQDMAPKMHFWRKKLQHE
jgi:ribosomal protein S18 acetylase RimI-like enzyme